MTLEQTIEQEGLQRHNQRVARDMQIAYLNSYDALQKYGIDKDQYMMFYVFRVHGQPKEYQTHLNFHRGEK